MRALEIASPNVVNELSVPIPEIGNDEVLIRVAYSGICATDYEILGGQMALIREGKIRYPVRFGHEWSGVVEKVGCDVTKFVPGDHVISDSGVACGTCEACQENHYAACPNVKSVGTVNCWDGSFAEYMHIPERHLYKLPESIPLKLAAIIEPSGIALEGVRKIRDIQDKTVLVIGTGAIGMTAVAFAKYAGASKVLLAGRTDEKLRVGEKLGADRVINITTENLSDIIMEETNGNGVYGTIETSGNIEAVSQCPDLTAFGGTVAYIGFYDEPARNFPIDTIVSREQTVCGVMGHFGSANYVIDALQSGKLDLMPIVTHEIPFSQAKQAMLCPESLEGIRIKILVNMA